MSLQGKKPFPQSSLLAELQYTIISIATLIQKAPLQFAHITLSMMSSSVANEYRQKENSKGLASINDVAVLAESFG